MSSRSDILSSIRSQQIADVPRPDHFTEGIVYDDPVAQFCTVLAGVGGRVESISSTASASEILDALPEYADAGRTCSLVPGIGRSSFDLTSISDPHDLDDVDFAVLPGDLAVAENGAIWVTTPDVRIRTLYFLVQHLALVVPRCRIVSNMHQAYETIEIGQHPFGTWISGPSKTADIEQSLVKGAHGARSLLVLMTDELR